MNIIEVPSEHKMFFQEFEGTLENFIFNEFAIAIKTKDKIDIGVIVLFEQGINGTQFILNFLDNKPIKENIRYEIYLNENANDGMEILCNTDKFKYLNIGHDLAQAVFRIMIYIMNTPREKTVKNKLQRKDDKPKENKTKVQKENKIYLLDEIVEYVSEKGFTVDSNGTHKINCPCWSVRGHYRHYKSGKVIFIQNYKKGKERDSKEPKDKTYNI